MSIYCYPDAPEELQKLGMESFPEPVLRKLCALASDEKLRTYLDKITMGYPNLREIVKDEMDHRRHLQVASRLDSLREPHWMIRWTFIVSVMILVVAYLAWILPRSPVVDAVKPTAPLLSQAEVPAANSKRPSVSQWREPRLPASTTTNSVDVPSSSRK